MVSARLSLARGSFEKPKGGFGIALAGLLESPGRFLGWPMGGAEQPMGDLSLRFQMFLSMCPFELTFSDVRCLETT